MCGLFGIYDYKNKFTVKQKERLIKILSIECEIRGTDATGVAYNSDTGLTVFKRPLPAHNLKFKFRCNPSVIMGHTRLTTQGSERFNCNNHPFIGKVNNTRFALAHNGIIYNELDLRKKFNIPNTRIQTDSYIIVQLLESFHSLEFEGFNKIMENLLGSFCFSVLKDDNTLILIKGNNPLFVYDLNGAYIYASTKDILNNTIKKLSFIDNCENIDINQGEILKLTASGSIERTCFFNENCFYEPRRDIKYTMSNDYLNDLVSYAKTLFIDEEFIWDLYDNGYSCEDIEEFLYDTRTWEDF